MRLTRQMVMSIKLPLTMLATVALVSEIVGAGLLSRAEPRDAPPRPASASSSPANLSQGPLLPEQSAAKAKELIQSAIQALGGQAYLGVRDVTCTGRLAGFGTTGDLTGYSRIFDYVKLPDKNRTEYYKQRNIISVRNANQGWELDRGGVVEASADSVEEFQEGLKKSLDHLFRFRLNEEGMNFRYASTDIVDLKQVEWVEVVDRERRTFRIAFEQSTRLPLRAVYITRDPATRQRVEEIEYFSLYHPVQGVMTPFQFARDLNGRPVHKVFWETCQINTGLADSLFTRESLEQRFAELNKGKKKK